MAVGKCHPGRHCARAVADGIAGDIEQRGYEAGAVVVVVVGAKPCGKGACRHGGGVSDAACVVKLPIHRSAHIFLAPVGGHRTLKSRGQRQRLGKGGRGEGDGVAPGGGGAAVEPPHSRTIGGVGSEAGQLAAHLAAGSKGISGGAGSVKTRRRTVGHLIAGSSGAAGVQPSQRRRLGLQARGRQIAWSQPAAVGRYAHDGALIGVEVHRAGGVHRRKGVESVIVAAPAKVEVEEGVCRVAVAHKAVSARTALPAIHHGAAGVEVGHQHLLPSPVAVVHHVVAVDGGAVFEVVSQCRLGRGSSRADGGSAAARGAVVHLHRHAAVIEQRGHGGLLGGGACRREGGGHIGPVVGGAGKVGRQLPIIGGVAVAARARGRMIPILHHLPHGGGHAAGDAVVALIAVVGAELVVVGALIPSGCQQSVHHHGVLAPVAADGQAAPLGGDILGRDIARCTSLAYLLFVAVQPLHHLRRDAFDRKGAAVRIAEDGTSRVVARHYHKAAAGTGGGGGEDIQLAKGGRGGDVLQPLVGKPLVIKPPLAEEIVCHSEGGGRVNWFGHQRSKP